MAITKKKLKPSLGNKEKTNFLTSAGKHMTYKDLKRQAIILGMPFPDACKSSIFGLIGYINHSNNTPDTSLIDQYDEWVDKQLEDIGYEKDDPLRSSRLRLGFLGEEKENGERKSRRIPGIKKQKPRKTPKERDEFNLVKGTKKSYTFELANKGFSLERTIRRVKKKFPEANDKSINLWYRKAKRDGKAIGKQSDN